MINVTEVGSALLAAVFLLCSFSAVFSFVSARLPQQQGRKYALWASRAQLAAIPPVVAGILLLARAFLRDDFSLAAVAQYSSAQAEWFYKLSAVWAGDRGSLLLWLCGLVTFVGLWALKTSRDSSNFTTISLSIGSAVCAAFAAILVFLARPFALAEITIDAGIGLNPLLRNVWMIVHPPLLFLGYSILVVPFAAAAGAVFSRDAQNNSFYADMRKWLLFAFFFLSAGIATGARWSYMELGWGGYWAWDPVENGSLLSWLAVVAAVHSLVGVRYYRKFKIWAFGLLPAGFVLALVSTFITRSGILQSVHSFGGGAMFWTLLTFIAACVVLQVVMIISAYRQIGGGLVLDQKAIFSKAGLLFWLNVILIAVVLVVGVATFWPLLTGASDAGATVGLTRGFYDRLAAAAGMLLVAILGVNCLGGYSTDKRFFGRFGLCCFVGAAAFAALSLITELPLLTAAAAGLCAFALVAILIKLFLQISHSGRLGSTIAHLGFITLVLAAGLAHNKQTFNLHLQKAQQHSSNGITLSYTNFRHQSGEEMIKAGPEIQITTGRNDRTLWPHNNVYDTGQRTAEVAVWSLPMRDIYLAFEGVGPGGGVLLTVRIIPMINWLWVGIILILAGSAWAFLTVRKTNK